ncbi:MAG TPA: DnaB-like helicase N-terminal domain-containing protein [Verrucomicrobiae bacterium]|nr:DnaB-like helicase N-terminal domain-containing protein [Verrucomicrobiae bacterium]
MRDQPANVIPTMHPATDILPPHSDEAERAALGCLLLAPESAAANVTKLTRSDFYDLRHQNLFTTISRIVRAGQTPDTVTVVQRLTDKNELETVGGLEYIVALPDAAPSALSLPSYVVILKDKASRRELLALAAKAQQMAGNQSLDAAVLAREFTTMAERVAANSVPSRNWLNFYSPTELLAWQPPAGHILVGDCAIVRGGLAVIAGPPGVGKSRGATALAIAGAKGAGATWFGLPIHAHFKTVIVQCENGRYRLKQEFSEIYAPEMEESIRVSDRPEFGLAFDASEFRRTLADYLTEFSAGLLILDPWNTIARDDGIRDYRAALENIMAALPHGERMPAVLVVAHTRKPKGDDRKLGRALLHELSGSYALGSAARSVFMLQHASDDTADDRVVFTCAKNNDGSLGVPSAWHRRNGLFVPCEDFDWEEFEQPTTGSSGSITKSHLEKLFDGGKRRLARKKAVAELVEMTKFKKTACYAALHPQGRFRTHLSEDADGLLSWSP